MPDLVANLHHKIVVLWCRRPACLVQLRILRLDDTVKHGISLVPLAIASAEPRDR